MLSMEHKGHHAWIGERRIMWLKEILIHNYRGIEDLEIPFDGKTTILFGINGVGKTSILNAVDILYADIIAKLTTSKKQAELEYDDISYGKSSSVIDMLFCLDDGKEIQYGCSISRADGRKYKTEELSQLTEEFTSRYIVKGYDDGNGNWIEEEDTKDMPVFVDYSVNRLVADIPLSPVKSSDYDQVVKLSVFDEAIESKIDFNSLFEWFRNQEDIENQDKVRKQADYEDRSLRAVKRAMLAMMDGFEDIYIDRKPLAMKVKKNGQYLKINQLSDGEKCTIALFGDLARRMALANPRRDNPLEGNGVVLIDELDLHMHTSWQRKVVRVLRETFPNIQFVITTHSPQILGEGDEDINLFYLVREEQGVLLKSYHSFIGWDANVILEEIMNTPAMNLKIKEQVAELYDCIERKDYGKAEAIADMLDEKSNGYIDGIAKARVLISRGRRREKNNEADVTDMV